MSITLRTRKNGEQVYEIRIFRGRDPETGKQFPSYTTVYHIPEGLTPEEAEAEALLAEAAFRKRCEAGLVTVKKEETPKRPRRKKKQPGALPKHPTYKEYTEHYLKQFAVSHAPSTILNYRQALERANPILGDRKMEKITKNMVRSYITSLQVEDGLKFSTSNRHYTILQLFFEAAVEEGIIQESPMATLKRPRKPKDERGGSKEAEKAYDVKKVAYLFDCLENEPLKWKALVTFMLDSGCRRAEVAGLRWRDIDLATGRVTISNTLQYAKELGVYETSPKSGKNREIFLNDQALEVMRQWKAIAPEASSH